MQTNLEYCLSRLTLFLLYNLHPAIDLVKLDLTAYQKMIEIYYV